MKDIALNVQTHDLSLRLTAYGYDIRSVDLIERVAQQIKIALLTLLGEWFLDVTKGIPYLTDVMGKAPRLPTIEGIFRQRIMAVEGVRRVNSLTLDMNQRQRYLRVSFECDTLYGIVEQTIDAPLVRGL